MAVMGRRTVVAVVGQGECDEELGALAHEVGRLVAQSRAVLVCGGRDGVMLWASRGAQEAGGLTIGLLPGFDKGAANPYVDAALPTGLGNARNAVIAQCCDAMIAVGGGPGTLSEVALALKAGKRVVGLRFSYRVDGVVEADTAAQALDLALGP
jgi:uncharacterized protein (TIGR00725 family)